MEIEPKDSIRNTQEALEGVSGSVSGGERGLSSEGTGRGVNEPVEQNIEGLEYNSIKLADYADLVDQFRWIFVRNSEGNYIFEKMEKVK